MKTLEKVKIQELCWTRELKLLGKHSNHFKNVKTSLKNDHLDKVFINNILYFAGKYLKTDLLKKPDEIGSIHYGPGIKYLLNTVQ